jgi:hypothetical protein
LDGERLLWPRDGIEEKGTLAAVLGTWYGVVEFELDGESSKITVRGSEEGNSISEIAACHSTASVIVLALGSWTSAALATDNYVSSYTGASISYLQCRWEGYF